MRKALKNPLTYILIFLASVMLFRFYLSLVRYFDPDEFAHLHWTYLLSVGRLPYRDIFMYHIPLYQLILMPFFLLPQSEIILLIIRIFTFAVYAANLYLIYLTVRRLSGKTAIALLSVSVLSVFPMTMDKTVDIRPDMIMVLFFQISLYLLVRRKPQRNEFLLSGLFYGLSLLTFPKIIYGLPPLLYILYSESKNQTFRGKIRNLFFFSVSTVLPFAIFGAYLALNGLLPDAYASVLKNSVAVTAGKWKFTPWLALSPWPLVYVEKGGMSWPWITNSAFWIMSIVGLVILFFNSRKLFFISFLFLAGGTILLFLFPSPYLQYFLPLTVFASVPVASMVYFIYEKTRFIPVLIIFLVAIFLSFIRQVVPRLHTDSKEQMTVIKDLLTVSRKDETFFDMVGSYVFRPDAYYLCCHPYVEFSHLLPYRVPPLSEKMKERKTKFIIMDRTGLLFWKTPQPDLSFLEENYLQSNYRKIYTLGWHFKCKEGACRQYNVHGLALPSDSSYFNVPVAEKYVLRKVPMNSQVTIDGKTAGDRLELSEGRHEFSVSPGLTDLEIQLDR